MNAIAEVIAAEKFEEKLRRLSKMTKAEKAKKRAEIEKREKDYEREHSRMNEWIEICKRFGLSVARDESGDENQEGCRQ